MHRVDLTRRINEKTNPKLLQNLVNIYHIVSSPFLTGNLEQRGSNYNSKQTTGSSYTSGMQQTGVLQLFDS